MRSDRIVSSGSDLEQMLAAILVSNVGDISKHHHITTITWSHIGHS